jgi:hypothetical protein
MKAALDGRGDPALVIVARTGAASITSLDDAIARAKAYEATGVDALFFTGIKTRERIRGIAAATTLPIVLGGAPEEMSAGLSRRTGACGSRCRATLPFAAATQAVYETLKALREGLPPKDLKGLASSELTGQRHARGRRESAAGGISRIEALDERRDPPGDDPRPGAGRRLPRLDRASGEGARTRGLGAQRQRTAASRPCFQGRRMPWLIWWRHAGVDRHRRASMPSWKNPPISMHWACGGQANGFRCCRRSAIKWEAARILPTLAK